MQLHQPAVLTHANSVLNERQERLMADFETADCSFARNGSMGLPAAYCEMTD
jgi:hypothetical protein